MDSPKRRRRLGWLLLIPLVLVVCIVGGFVVWLVFPAGPMPEALPSLESDEAVEVVSGDWLTFRPKGQNPNTGLILYPGARIEPQAYAPAAHQIAAQGYLVLIPHMPLNVAMLNANVASEIMARYPHVQYWAIGGHSLGGVMAAQYAYDHPGAVDGLLLWAAYPPAGDDFTQSDLKILSIFGSEDFTVEQLRASKSHFSADITWIEIEGGNHGQFGYYGDQPGDNPATISREDQQQAILDATLEFLAALRLAK